MNFAPVLDIKNFDEMHSIGNRCYGENVDDVSKFGICAMKVFQTNNIIPVVKTFSTVMVLQKLIHTSFSLLLRRKRRYRKRRYEVF